MTYCRVEIGVPASSRFPIVVVVEKGWQSRGEEWHGVGGWVEGIGVKARLVPALGEGS